jgi:hypothetical protein
MVEDKECDAPLLYNRRIQETELYLDYIASYFKAVKDLQKYQFNVSESKLEDILLTNQVICHSVEELVGIMQYDTGSSLSYLMSFLKSLDIRECVYCDKKRGLKLLRKQLVSENMQDIYTPHKMLQVYERYLQEVDSKKKELNKKIKKGL